MASEANTAVVFRRGPTRWTRLYLWDTRTDHFTPGSWFAGHLYPWSSDLSPDGRHLLYFARNDSERRVQAAAKKFGEITMQSWTGLCQPPWVRALGLWNASGGWSGGGVFEGNRSLKLNHPAHSLKAQIEPAGFTVQGLVGREQLETVVTSLQRTGWRLIHRPERWSGMGEDHPIVFRKRALELRFISTPKYKRYVTYHWHGTTAVPALEGASWADLDQQQRLVMAKEGRLYRVNGTDVRELIDLNPDQPRGRPTPPEPLD